MLILSAFSRCFGVCLFCLDRIKVIKFSQVFNCVFEN